METKNPQDLSSEQLQQAALGQQRDDADARRRAAQGYPQVLVPCAEFPLIGFDISVKPGDGVYVDEVEVRNTRTDAYGVGITIELRKGQRWVNAMVSWTDLGTRGGQHIETDHRGEMSARIWCHPDYRDPNLLEIKSLMAKRVEARIAVMEEFLETLRADAPRPGSRAKP